MSIEVTRWDPSEDLNTAEDISNYINAVMEESDDPRLLQSALGDVVRAVGMSKVAASAQVGRESLYKSLCQESNPSFQTITKVLAALDLEITVKPTNTHMSPVEVSFSSN